MLVKILIVDDESPFRLGIRCYLADEGYSVVEADRGPAALNAFDSEKPDLILLDIRMPGMSGLEVLRELRAKSLDVPIIMVSGAGEMSDVVESMRLGASDFVSKPIVDIRILRQVIQKGLDRLQLVNENKAYRLRLEEMITERTSQLASVNESLQRKSIALQEILSTYQAESAKRTSRIVERIEQFVRPILEKTTGVQREELLTQFNAAISNATSDTLDQLSQKLAVLSPSELRVCEMIRRGMGTKEIAVALGITADTIETHRRNIRRKLRINNETVNLSTFLRQIFEESNSSFLG
jgi:FixJ family two-component response regulator